MKIYLMHQTHTDIGYTDRQEKITKYHVDYLKQAIKISETIAEGKKAWEGFVWNNETHWIIEKFIEATNKDWLERLIKAINRGHIQLAGNYLNLTDLVDDTILRKYLKKARHFADEHNVRLDSAISMDINGWSWGYADALYDAGIKHFYTCIHNHHGFVPFEKKHMPFYWETEEGNKVLVWHGEVYNHGNVSRLMPDVKPVYKDGKYITEAIITDEQLSYVKTWIDDYLSSMNAQGYRYDFLPMMTKGLLVDNAPPNPHIMESIQAFNHKYGDEIEIEMIGINDFFDILKKKNLDIPTFKGDWNDWWSDGFASTPGAVQLYKEAQRKYHQIRHLHVEGHAVNQKTLEDLEYNLMMFSEHTWGYFTSVSEPWNHMTKKLEDRNKHFASQASLLADTLLDDITFNDGEMAKAAGRPMLYKIKNPYPEAKTQIAHLYTNWWEAFMIDEGYDVVDSTTNQPVKYQEIRVDEQKRRQINVVVELEAFESKTLEIRPSQKKKPHMPLDPLFTRDETYDYVSPYLDNTVNATNYYFETPHIYVAWDFEQGIHTIKDKKTNTNIRRDDTQAMFVPIYETTPVEYTYDFDVPDMQDLRRQYGRNRKLMRSQRSFGTLINVRVLDKGPEMLRVQFKYQLKGLKHCILEMKAYKNLPQLDVSLIFQKDTVWQPESVYLSLPFTTGHQETLYIDKAGTIIRPRIDQLDKTQAQFYTTQNGYALQGKNLNLHVAMPDTPLLYLGDLAPGLMKIHDGNHSNQDNQHAWLMNNYWETNFATQLGGFYRFEFKLGFSHASTDKHDLMKKTKALTDAFLVYQVNKDEK